MSGRKVFALFGVIGLEGAEGVFKKLNSIDKAAKDLSKQLMKTGKQFEAAGKSLTKGITAPVIAAGAAIFAMTSKIGVMADQLLDLKDITGLSTDSLQELQHVSKVAGVSFDGLTGIISKFTNQVPEIEKGGNAASRAFSQLGVPLKDVTGKTRDMNEMFFEILDALREVENVTDRNALAQDIFGRSLTDLAPVLSMTKEQMQDVRKEAHTLGLVMTEEALVSANDFRIEIEKVKEQVFAAGRTIAMGFIPIFRDTLFPAIKDKVIPAMREMAEKIKSAVERFQNLNPSVKETVLKMLGFVAAAGPALLIIGKLMKAVAGLRVTVLALNSALLANPFGIAIIAIGLFTVGIVDLVKHYKNLNAEIDENHKKLRDDFTIKQNEKIKGSLQELIFNYRKLESIDKGEAIFPKEDYERTRKDIKALETNLSDMGVALSGNKIESARKELEKMLPVVEDIGEEISIMGDSEEIISEDAIKKAKKLSKEYSELVTKWGEEEAEGHWKAKQEATEKEKKLAKEYYDLVTKWGEEEAEANFKAKQDLRQREKDAKKWAIDFELQHENISFKKRIQLINEERRIALATENLTQQEILNINMYYDKKILDAKISLYEKIKDNVSYYFGELVNVFTGFNQNRMIELENYYAKEKEKIEESTLSKEGQEKALIKLEENVAKKKMELNKKAARLEKVSAIFSIGVSTAQAIMKAWATLPYYAAIAATIIIGGLGAAQTSVVASKPLPYAEKGAFLSGSEEGTHIVAGEKRKPEIIFPLDTGIEKLAVALEKRQSGKMQMQTMRKSNNSLRPINLNIGTLIADKRGLADLQSRLEKIRIDVVEKRA